MTLPYTKVGPFVNGTTPALSAANMNLIDQGVYDTQMLTGSSPPGSPVTGMLWCRQIDATNGINWTFRYNSASASAFKWEFVGGAPLYAEVDTSQSLNSATYVDLATAGPSVTAPRAGDYTIHFGARGNVPGVNGQTFFVSPKIGAAATQDADAAVISSPGLASAHVMDGSTSRSRFKTLAASDVIKVQYRQDTASAFNVLNRFVFLTPIRVS